MIWYLIVATTVGVGDRNCTNLLVDIEREKVYAVDAADRASCFLSSSLMECLFTKGKLSHNNLFQQLLKVVYKNKVELEKRMYQFRVIAERDQEFDGEAWGRLETILNLLNEE